jgi:hypothetical protein
MGRSRAEAEEELEGLCETLKRGREHLPGW